MMIGEPLCTDDFDPHLANGGQKRNRVADPREQGGSLSLRRTVPFAALQSLHTHHAVTAR